MKYKFFGEKNTSINTRKQNWYNGEWKFLRVGKFNEDGEFETSDPEIIKKMKGRFDCIEIKESEETEEVKELKPREEIEEKAEIEKMSYNKLRKLASEKGFEKKSPTKKELLTYLNKEEKKK